MNMLGSMLEFGTDMEFNFSTNREVLLNLSNKLKVKSKRPVIE